MTVARIEGDKAVCVWHNAASDLMECEFGVRELTRVDDAPAKTTKYKWQRGK